MAGHDGGWLVVGSTAAGSSGEDAIEAVAGRLSRSGPVSTAVTEGLHELDEVVRSCGARTLVAVGGDGSAHAVANALDRAGLLGSTTVGFVPLGTANDFATHLGLDADPRTAADQLLDAPVRRMDVLRVEAEPLDRPVVVVNALHAGLGVDGARRAARLKPILRRFAYPVGVASLGAVSRGARLSVTLDGKALDDGSPVLAVAVANAPRLGAVNLVTDADPGDGLLRVLVVPARPWSARVATARRRLAGTVDADQRSGSVVELAGDLDEIDADGELLEVGSRCQIVVDHGAISVVAPAVSS